MSRRRFAVRLVVGEISRYRLGDEPPLGNTSPGEDMPYNAPDRDAILMSDPRFATMPIRDNAEPLVRLDGEFGPARAKVRVGLARRLERVSAALPSDVQLRVLEGHRTIERHRRVIERYNAEVATAYPDLSTEQQTRVSSRFAAPIEVAPHLTGGAVDVTLLDAKGRELDLGTRVGAMPVESWGLCWFTAVDLGPNARARREVLAAAMAAGGLVNYPAEWWHWSYGDNYWALTTGQPTAVYGPV